MRSRRPDEQGVSGLVLEQGSCTEGCDASSSHIEPKITVLLRVYNGQQFIRQAIESVLGQDRSDFEFLIVDDGSTDETASILSEYLDPRIRRLHHENRGLPGTTARGVVEARGELIALIDADDIMARDRLTLQAAMFASDNDVVIVGSDLEIMNEEGRTVGSRTYPHSDTSIRRSLLFSTPSAIRL